MFSRDAEELLTLSRADLSRLLDEAVARGAAQAIVIDRSQWLDNREAARHFYGRDDRLNAWKALRSRYPQIDAISVGSNRLRRWRRSDLDALIASNPQITPHETRSAADACANPPAVTDREVGHSA